MLAIQPSLLLRLPAGSTPPAFAHFQMFWNGSSSNLVFCPWPAVEPPNAPKPVSKIGAGRAVAVPPQTSCEETKWLFVEFEFEFDVVLLLLLAGRVCCA